MTQIVTGPDGQQHEFPDEATPEQIKRAMQQHAQPQGQGGPETFMPTDPDPVGAIERQRREMVSRHGIASQPGLVPQGVAPAAPPQEGGGNALWDFVTRPGTPMNLAKGYAERVGSDFMSGFEQSGRGARDIVDSGFSGNFKQGNVLTGVPRVAMGGLGAIASPVTAAISPATDLVLPSVAGFVDENISKPIEQATGYPSDITTNAAIQLGTAGLMKGVRLALPKTSLPQAEVAHTLMNEGVPVYPGQLARNKMLRNAYDMADQVSVYDNGAAARQADALARMESRTMGENTPDLREAIGNARERLGGTIDPQNPLGPKLQPGVYDQTYARIGDHAVDNVALNELALLDQRAASLSDRTAETVRNAIDNVMSAVQNGQITIRGFKDLTDHGGPLTELANSPHPTVAAYGQQLRGILERNIQRQAAPADAQALAQADRQWRHMRTLERPVTSQANAEGQLPPSRMQSDIANAPGGPQGMPELQAIGQAGKSFLRPPRSSGTAERQTIANMVAKPMAMLAGTSGAGALAAGAPGALVAGGLAVTVPPAFRALMQRQWLARMMVDEARARGANPNALRRMLTNAARDARHSVPLGTAATNADERKRMLTPPR